MARERPRWTGFIHRTPTSSPTIHGLLADRPYVQDPPVYFSRIGFDGKARPVSHDCPAQTPFSEVGNGHGRKRFDVCSAVSDARHRSLDPAAQSCRLLASPSRVFGVSAPPRCTDLAMGPPEIAQSKMGASGIQVGIPNRRPAAQSVQASSPSPSPPLSIPGRAAWPLYDLELAVYGIKEPVPTRDVAENLSACGERREEGEAVEKAFFFLQLENNVRLSQSDASLC
ncbi:hypothetical protein HRG_012772 [Hirsutella rhossiliensis]